MPGVWVAGNVADIRAQVITSAAAGLNAGGGDQRRPHRRGHPDAVAAYRHRVRTMFEEPAWEERYRSRPSVWSGRPNPQLVAEVTGLAPARALDVGSGEGADAVWLAERGWQVTAVDISTTALEPGRRARRGRRRSATASTGPTPTYAASRPPRARTTWCPRSSCTCPAEPAGAVRAGWPRRWHPAASC